MFRQISMIVDQMLISYWDCVASDYILLDFGRFWILAGAKQIFVIFSTYFR